MGGLHVWVDFDQYNQKQQLNELWFWDDLDCLMFGFFYISNMYVYMYNFFQVYPHKFIMDEQSLAWGRMRAGPKDKKVCIDHLQKDMVCFFLYKIQLFKGRFPYFQFLWIL